jgi:hypothetical protein
MRNIPLYRAGAFFILAVALTLLPAPASYAQWAGPNIQNILPLQSLEELFGPLFPPTSFANTFRSEFGLRFSAAEIQKAQLKGSESGVRVDLSPDLEIKEQTVAAGEGMLETYLNGTPNRLDAYVNLRVWRLGLRANYADFLTRSTRPGLGYIDFSGMSVGVDFDIVHREWLTIGIAGDYYFKDPTFNGYVPANTVKAWQVEPDYVGDVLRNYPIPWGGWKVPPTGKPLNFDGAIANPGYDMFAGRIRGKRPVTVGYYGRYIPPEILGFPVYFESFLNYKVRGSQLMSFGASLVFRPQIYRFDILTRLKFQRLALKFAEETTSSVGPNASFTVPQTWEIDAAWNLYGIEFAIYF